MITIDNYDITQPSMRKAWKAEFHNFLIDYYRPFLVNAETIFNAVDNVNEFIKKHTTLDTKLLLIKDEKQIQSLREKILQHQPYAMGATVSANDSKVIVLDRYIEFLHISSRQENISQNDTASSTSDDVIEHAIEGKLKETSFFRRQRNRAIRKLCAEKYHYRCYVCGMDFETVYGERGHEFIEVHHLKPLASYDEEHDIPLDELCALCSNCHSMVHHGKELLDVKELKKRYETNKENRELF